MVARREYDKSRVAVGRFHRRAAWSRYFCGIPFPGPAPGPALIFVASILLIAFLLVGMAAAFPEEPLAPLICPFPAAPSSFWGAVTLNGIEAQPGLKPAAWINGVEVATTMTQIARKPTCGCGS